MKQKLIKRRHRILITISLITTSLIPLSSFAQTPTRNKEKEQNANLKIQENLYFNNENKKDAPLKKIAPNKQDYLFARAVLPAASFSKGPTSGKYINKDTINGVKLPFENKQPIQGFSSILYNKNGTFTALSDNGFGSIENSADYNLRLYVIKPNFKYHKYYGKGSITIINYIELSDPNNLIDFPIVNEFEKSRILTGADFDIESIQRDRNGDFWIGDEFGPFILHFNKKGELMDTPFSLPDLKKEGTQLRSPQNPYNEEVSALRVMNAMRANALRNGGKTPVISPWFVMLTDEKKETKVDSRENPPSGLPKADSEIINLNSLNSAGFPVVAYTVNDLENMSNLLNLNIQGIISDEPDLLLKAVTNFDSNNDGKPDYLDKDGLIDVKKFDAQGHRGARNLRPENTLPSMEAALDYLMPTLETDCGITKDGHAVLGHDPYIEAAKARKTNGKPYEYKNEVLIKNLTLKEIQNTFIADKLLAGRPKQSNDLALSPVTVAFAAKYKLMNTYQIPSLQNLFDFVYFYTDYYKNGNGSTHPDAYKRWKNASRVRFNIETKINPRTDKDDKGMTFTNRTAGVETFTNTISETIVKNDLENRCDIQSFDFRTLIYAQNKYPNIRTVCLFGDFPKIGDRGDGTNLQDQNGENTPWLAGMKWPYRVTKSNYPFKVKQSGGFEGMAITPNGKTLLPLLEKPLTGSTLNELLISEFDIETKNYTNKHYSYPLNKRATAIGDFILFGNKRGLIIERDGTQGDLKGFKSIYEIELNNDSVVKKHQVDLLKLVDHKKISLPGEKGDIGIGKNFAFPFVTIESVIVLNRYLIGVLNDNNYPFSVGRHLGNNKPDATEFILVWLNEPLGSSWDKDNKKKFIKKQETLNTLKVFPNTFSNAVTFSLNEKNHKNITIKIYNEIGELIKTINHTNNNNKPFIYKWNATSETGNNLKTGIYFAIIEMDGSIIKKKLVKE